MIKIAEKLVNKRMVDVDALMDYLENDTDLGYESDFMSLLQNAVERFTSTTVPNVEVGQIVHVITDGAYDFESGKNKKIIIKCVVHRKTIKTKYTFSVRGRKGYYNYNGNFTLSSIGKTVFFKEEDAKMALASHKH